MSPTPAPTATLVTGLSGFIGRELARALPGGAEHSLWGMAWRSPVPEGLEARTLRGDLTDPEWVDRAVARIRPDRVFHLAGQSRESLSWRDPWRTYQTNLRSQLNLLQALARHAPGCRVLLASTSAVYGFMQGESIAEDHPVQPVSPYGVSKAAAEMMARQMALAADLNLLVVRSFNVIGPGQSSDFALSSFARQIAAIEAGRRPPVVETGSLAARRDFLDVRDMASALGRVMDQGTPGEVYNIGSGVVVQLQDALERLVACGHTAIEVRTAAQRLRPNDPPVMRANIARLRALGGWRPAVPLDATLRDMLNCWRAALAADPAPVEHKEQP